MSDGNSAASLRRKMDSAGELQSVVRTMKAMAAASIGQYENALRSLDAYYHTVQLALSACFQQGKHSAPANRAGQEATAVIGVVVFGSDQGLVGPFNEAMADFVVTTMDGVAGEKIIWTVGERIESRMADTALTPAGSFSLPNSIDAITPLVGQILAAVEALREKNETSRIYLCHHRPESGATYVPVSQRLLPLDASWRHDLSQIAWPTRLVPEVLNDPTQALLAFVREYLFVSIFRACAQSLASENASRLAAMQRAEKNIDELLADLGQTYHQLRQSSIDEELFDVVSGFEALSKG